jgi:hypothetical protein
VSWDEASTLVLNGKKKEKTGGLHAQLTTVVMSWSSRSGTADFMHVSTLLLLFVRFPLPCDSYIQRPCPLRSTTHLHLSPTRKKDSRHYSDPHASHGTPTTFTRQLTGVSLQLTLPA